MYKCGLSSIAGWSMDAVLTVLRDDIPCLDGFVPVFEQIRFELATKQVPARDSRVGDLPRVPSRDPKR
jgi:hypothetical protein